MKLFKGNIIYTKDKSSFEILEGGYICESDGLIIEVGYNLDKKYAEATIKDYSNQLLIPGFVDLHFHAVQYGNLGIGLDEVLLDWLNAYTFKEEEKFEDLEYAELIFKAALNHIVASGTTRIVFFSSIHEAATKLLMKMCEEVGLGAFVGKVNMDRNAPEPLLESTDASFEITNHLARYKSEYVEGIVTPRFVPSCTSDLMKKLGALAQAGYAVQTHISETQNEIKWVKSLHPEAKNYLDVYNQNGLIGPRTILAHCVYCDEDEKQVIKEKNAYVAHCPTANLNLTSGIMDVKDYIDRGIHVGLGTDVGAGQTPSVKHVIVHAIQMSKVNRMLHQNAPVLSFSEAFYLATKGGGAYFGKVGSFEPGYALDMLVVEVDPLTRYRQLPIVEQLQRFVYSGKDDQIKERYCMGKVLKTY